MLHAEFYRLYSGLWARDLMPCLCGENCDFHKSTRCFLYHFGMIFYCPYEYRNRAVYIRRKASRAARSIDASDVPRIMSTEWIKHHSTTPTDPSSTYWIQVTPTDGQRISQRVPAQQSNYKTSIYLVKSKS